MAVTVLTPQAIPAKYALAGATLTWVAVDAASGAKFTLTGEEILLVRNDNASARTVTVVSVADERGRTGDQVKSVAAAAYAVFAKLPRSGFMQSDGTLHVTVSGADIFAAVLRIPAN